MSETAPGHQNGSRRQKPVMRVTTGSLKVPEAVAASTEGHDHRGIDRIALAIAAGAIAFILCVAWLISRTGS